MMSDPHPWARRATRGGIACLLVGDVNLQDRVDPASTFRRLSATLAGADVLFGNLEGCLYRAGEGDIPGKRSWRHSDASMVRALSAVNFTAVGCANNVTYGVDATLASLRVLDQAGIAHCGAGPNRESARAPVVVERLGVRVGLVQYTARLHSPGQAAAVDRPGVAAFDPDDPGDLAEIYADVAALRRRVDVLVVSHHLRSSGSSTAEPYQRRFARGCIEAGADVVYGHGAHVHQGIELWRGAPILHCVGQLIFDSSAATRRQDGLLVRLLIEGGRVAGVTALLTSRDEGGDPYLADPRGDEGRRQLAALRGLSPGVDLPVRDGEVVIVPGSDPRPAP